MQKIDFESQNFAIFNNFYASLHKTQKKSIGQQFGLYPKGRPCKMCNSVQQKLGHTKVPQPICKTAFSNRIYGFMKWGSPHLLQKTSSEYCRGSKQITAMKVADQRITIRENYFFYFTIQTRRNKKNKPEIIRKRLLTCLPHFFLKTHKCNLIIT